MEKYLGYWRAGNTENINARQDSNVNRLRRDLKHIARGNSINKRDNISYSIVYGKGGKNFIEWGSFSGGKWTTDIEQR